MTPRVLLLSYLTILCFAMAAPAQERDKAKKADGTTNKALAELVQLGPGVHKIKSDDKGRITSCVVVAQARISTVLGNAKGLQDARAKARLACEAEFVRWLKTKVDVHAKNEEETILFLEGNEGPDKDALHESGKSVEKTSQKFEAVSQGLVRGLQVLGIDVNAKQKTYTLVTGWSAKTADATKQVRADLESDTPAAVGQEPTVKPGTERPGKRRGDKKLEDHKVISPELKKFLD